MIEVKNLVKAFQVDGKEFKALDDVSFKVNDGEIFGVIGLSGAGKSTLVRCINRLEEPDSGQIIIDGIKILSLSPEELRKERKDIGMIFQSFNLVDRMSVINNVLTAFVPELSPIRSIFGIYPKEYKIKALESLEKVDILDKAYVRADNLSGGQQQRVALARTLAYNPNIILADEPVASLDPINARSVMSYFKRINEEMKITILLNIHHVDLALEYATSVIGIKDGQIIYHGPSKDVNDKILTQIYGDSIDEIKKGEKNESI